MKKQHKSNEAPDLTIPLPKYVLKRMDKGKKIRTMILPGAESGKIGKETPYAKTYVRIKFNDEENLINCIKLLKWSDERLKKLPELLAMWEWHMIFRQGMYVYFSTWWWNKPYFEERKNAFFERTHVSYLKMFGASLKNITVEQEVVGKDKPFHYWID